MLGEAIPERGSGPRLQRMCPYPNHSGSAAAVMAVLAVFKKEVDAPRRPLQPARAVPEPARSAAPVLEGVQEGVEGMEVRKPTIVARGLT